MPEVVVIDPELSVYAPVASIDVAVDIGSTGTRGSKQFVGAGLPVIGTTIPSSETVLLNDLYFDITTSNLYQYVSGTPNNQWSYISKLAPNTYNILKTTSFTNGSSTVSFDINDMFGITELSTDETGYYPFIINYNFMGVTPIASVITTPQLNSTTLTFTIHAKWMPSTTWVDLSGDQDVMISISIGQTDTYSY